MGKASKKHSNRIAKQISSSKKSEDFNKMIEAMENNKYYRLKKHNSYLFDGQNLPGSYWKSVFLTPKTEPHAK